MHHINIITIPTLDLTYLMPTALDLALLPKMGASSSKDQKCDTHTDMHTHITLHAYTTHIHTKYHCFLSTYYFMAKYINIKL